MSSDLKQPLTAGGEKLTHADVEDLPVPIERRKCADVLFLLLFVVTWIGMLALGADSFISSGGVNGYQRLTNGVQYDGGICGVDSLKDEVYLYYPSPASSSGGSFALCVDTCPTKVEQLCRDICKDDACKTTEHTCWTTYPTKTVYHYCIPSAPGADADSISDFISHSSFGRMLADLGRAWPALVASAFVAVIVGFIYLWLLWCLGPLLVYSTIFLLIIGLGVTGYFLFSHGKTLAAGDQRTALIAAGIGVWILDVIFMLIVCCMRKSIAVALVCLKQATKAINAMKRLLLMPMIKFLILAVVMVWFVVVAVYIVSAGDFTSTTIHVPTTDLDVPIKTVVWTERLRYSLLFHFFGTLWTLAFVMAMADVILAGSVGHWYFSETVDGEKRLDSPVSKSVAIAVKKQFGAIAFGSLVLAIVWLIKWILRYLSNKAKKSNTEAARLVRFVLCMCRCCISCFECCVKFLERQAYIEMALFGQGFCHSAKRAFHLIARNAGRLIAVTYIGSVFSLLGIVLVMVASCLSTYFIVVAEYSGPDGVSSPIMPVFVTAIISFVVGSVFMQVLDMAIQTILHCYVADTEAHDGRPVFIAHDTEFTRALHKKGDPSTSG